MKKFTKIISRKLSIFIVIVIIVVIVVSSFQLYEFDSEPSPQLTLDQNSYKIMTTYFCQQNHRIPEAYTVNCSSYNASFFMATLSGYGGQSKMVTPYKHVLWFPAMRLFLYNYSTTSTYTYLSFEITNIVGKFVNLTCGNCTAICSQVKNFTLKLPPISNETSQRYTIHGIYYSVFPPANCYRYPHIPKYSKIHFPYRPINFTLYYSVTMVPIFHYHNLFTGYFTGKPITLVYDPSVVYTTLIPYYNCSTK